MYKNKIRQEGMYINLAKAMYYKPTANMILNRDKLEAFPL
jgi:hypothetical protein